MVWIGQCNKFFANLLYLMPYEGDEPSSPRLPVQYRSFKLPDNTSYRTEADLENIKIQPGKPARVDFNMFVGPKERELFDQNALYHKLAYRDTIELAGCFCTFAWLANVIMVVLEFLAKYLTLGNYGVAIIVLVIIMRVILHPLTKKQRLSMIATP